MHADGVSGGRTGMGFQPDEFQVSVWKSFVNGVNFTKNPNIAKRE